MPLSVGDRTSVTTQTVQAEGRNNIVSFKRTGSGDGGGGLPPTDDGNGKPDRPDDQPEGGSWMILAGVGLVLQALAVAACIGSIFHILSPDSVNAKYIPSDGNTETNGIETVVESAESTRGSLAVSPQP